MLHHVIPTACWRRNVARTTTRDTKQQRRVSVDIISIIIIVIATPFDSLLAKWKRAHAVQNIGKISAMLPTFSDGRDRLPADRYLGSITVWWRKTNTTREFGRRKTNPTAKKDCRVVLRVCWRVRGKTRRIFIGESACIYYSRVRLGEGGKDETKISFDRRSHGDLKTRERRIAILFLYVTANYFQLLILTLCWTVFVRRLHASLRNHSRKQYKWRKKYIYRIKRKCGFH